MSCLSKKMSNFLENKKDHKKCEGVCPRIFYELL